jgi:hypothetical protein
MSEPIRARGEGRTELQAVTCWPLIAGAAASVVAVLVAMSSLASPRDRPPESKAALISPTAGSAPTTAPRLQAAASLVVEQNRSVCRKLRNEEEPALNRSLLAGSRELDLESEPGAGSVLWLVCWQHVRQVERLRRSKQPTPSLSEPLEWLLQTREDLNGLPLLKGNACQTSAAQADVLGETSFRVRRRQGPDGRSSSAFDAAELCDSLADLGERVEGIADRRLLIRPLEQMIQHERAVVRAELVRTLATIQGKEATESIARRAVFDLSPLVRQSAIEALRRRDLAEAREVFLTACGHPWAPAADHAALALVALEDEGAVPRLVELLRAADSSAPYREGDGRWRRKELVRVNHMRNCLLCHPPSFSHRDPVTGPVPTPGEPLPEGYYHAPSQRFLVRADVVYFRQDFSVMHEVENPNRWPRLQRFDYLVQARELTEFEAKVILEKATRQPSSPQREAILWALERLEGERLRR